MKTLVHIRRHVSVHMEGCMCMHGAYVCIHKVPPHTAPKPPRPGSFRLCQASITSEEASPGAKLSKEALMRAVVCIGRPIGAHMGAFVCIYGHICAYLGHMCVCMGHMCVNTLRSAACAMQH